MPRIVKKKRSKKSRTPNGFLLLIGISLVVAGVMYYLNATQNSLYNQSRAAIEESAYFGKSRGYFITPQELAEIKRKADSSIEPHTGNVKELLTYSGSPTDWSHGSVGGNMTCEDSDAAFVRFRDAAHKTYAKALAYHLTGNEAYANDVRTRLLDLTDVTGFEDNEYSGANKCILELSWLTPSWIQAADLLEEYPGWTRTDKKSFQVWLKAEVYKKVAWSSRVRNNNWGSAGSATAMMIADYLWDSRLVLEEVSPQSKSLTPAQAYAEHRQMGLDRLNNTWKGDSLCTVHGIQPHGGIPDELRRGSTGCLGTYVVTTDSSYNYQNTHLEGSVSHAEFLHRRGDDSMYTNINSTGGGSIKNAIYFVIANPTASYDWVESKKSTLHMAQRFYRDSKIQQRLDSNNRYIKSGYMNVFGKLTHGFGNGEVLGATPVVPPPTDEILATPTPTMAPTVIPTNTSAPVIPTKTPMPTLTNTPTPAPFVLTEGDGLWANYFTDRNLTDYRFSRVEKYVNYNWKKGSPSWRIAKDNFSAKWTGYILSPKSGTYTFYVTADDGSMLRINGDNIIENWNDGSARTLSATVTFEAGVKNPMRLEYYERTGNASVKLEWSGPGFGRQVIPQKYLYTTK